MNVNWIQLNLLIMSQVGRTFFAHLSGIFYIENFKTN
jgi:hypothetical protein